MHGVAERIEDRGDLVGNVVGDRHDVVLRDGDILGEEPGRLTPTPGCCGRGGLCPRGSCGNGRRRVSLARDPLATLNSVTAAPNSATSPMNSWPMTIGTWIVFCAHSSQLQMWMSVPQIADF